ncbi:bacillithiol biosynthesis deacetylase BshB1 [Paenibacillus yanchengensis]|uniref:Bacillithiol biosynthesis deacetylase BshB1 n=1 Tax=Paenibacillus yanchengensis TaxID=2035833 RepID=A0ABW4YJY8_9BACL
MMDKLDILVFGAHADDAEIGMGGTIAKHTAQGYRVGICDLTQAEMSSNGNVELRQQEASQAASILGVAMRSNLQLPDRGLYGGEEQLHKIVAEIRKWQPKMVFAPFWIDRHPDHIACSKLIEEAVFNAKLRKYMPDLPAVQVEQLIYYYINDVEQVNIVVDVSEFYKVKMEALHAYRSQFSAPGTADSELDQVATPLTNSYIEHVAARDSLLGRKTASTYAEGFAIKQPFPIASFL